MARISTLWFSVAILASIAAWFAFSQIRYEFRVERARSTFSDAAVFEKGGQVQAAYRRYSTLCEGSFEIKRHDVPAGACDGAARLSRNMATAYEHTMAALERYREATGRLPRLLEHCCWRHTGVLSRGILRVHLFQEERHRGRCRDRRIRSRNFRSQQKVSGDAA
jgi:hypothetical protein